MTRKAGVLGHPIAHSLSPVLHRAAYAALDLDWDYQAYDVEAGGLADFLEGLDRDWAGLSLTMPLKVEAVGLVDFIEPFARLLGVINTIVIGGREASLQKVGANTDVHGIVAALGEVGVDRIAHGAIIGGGATAVSAVAALGQLGCTQPDVIVRSRARAGAVLRAASAMGLGVRFVDLEDADAVRAALGCAEAVVSTVPASAGEALAASLAEPPQARGVLLDAIYDPPVTPIAKAWLDWGGTRVGGERMLLHQAGEQVRLMTGHVAPLEAMDRALRSVLPTS